MNEEKQIEEMQKDIMENTAIYDSDVAQDVAETLVRKDYRKQNEGEWIWKSNGYKNRLHCSICNKPNEADISTNFCPNCGAKMKGGAE